MRTTNGRTNILRAARDTFAKKGFDGASIRDIAQEAGLSLSALYYYFPSKQDALFELIHAAFSWYIERTNQVIAEAGDDPITQLCQMTRFIVRYRVKNQAISRVVLRENERLQDAHFAQVRDLQREARNLLNDLLQEIKDKGLLEIGEVQLTGRAILSIVNTISLWYSPEGAYSPEEIEREFTTYVLRMVGVPTADIPALLETPLSETGEVDYLVDD